MTSAQYPRCFLVLRFQLFCWECLAKVQEAEDSGDPSLRSATTTTGGTAGKDEGAVETATLQAATLRVLAALVRVSNAAATAAVASCQLAPEALLPTAVRVEPAQVDLGSNQLSRRVKLEGPDGSEVTLPHLRAAQQAEQRCTAELYSVR